MTKIDNQKLLISYLENGFNLSETAKALGVCRQTVSKRIKSDKFQALLTEYRKNLFQESSQILLENTLRASRTLARLLDSQSENIRFQAACKILNLSNDFTTIDNLETELENLKSTIEGFRL